MPMKKIQSVLNSKWYFKESIHKYFFYLALRLFIETYFA
ncbi:hypothetical protein DFR66_101260 [Flavobacterium glaciei]|uniref:Uncharacterized protein n=1 Tax=Flavobacterium glaciei TaxID=386300 RepID=A0ABX9I169_9FLAO|nr:hypothetical protein DFR66_101260 [Flavobacterium glaciei]